MVIDVVQDAISTPKDLTWVTQAGRDKGDTGDFLPQFGSLVLG